MKIKKVDQKLSLNKKTIAHLAEEEMRVAKGGEETGPANCPTLLICITTHTSLRC